MSLTSQLNEKNSPVKSFFNKYEDKQGMQHCLKELQNSKENFNSSYTPEKKNAYATIGIITDYLIRYVANNNRLNFEETVAAQATQMFWSDSIHEHLFEIGKSGLNGNIATSSQAITSALAFSVLDGCCRSGQFPKIFNDQLTKDDKEKIKSMNFGRSYKEKLSYYLLLQYLNSLGGDSFINEIINVIGIFENGLKDESSEIYNIKFITYNQALINGIFIDGADFDCIIENDNKHILTEIKTITGKLTLQHLRQILGYALLYDEEKDDFSFNHLGFYYTRSGSFKYLPSKYLFDNCFPGFSTIEEIRLKFLNSINGHSNKISI